MAEVRRSYIDCMDGQIHVRSTAGSGRPIIFLHQTASSGAMWEKVMAALPDRRCHALDTPGFGNSFDPVTPPQMQDYARWLGEAIAALDPGPCHVVGHHTGAAIAAQIACDSPARVASLSLIGPLPLTRDERDGFAKQFGAPFTPRRSGAHLIETWEYVRNGGAGADVGLLHREVWETLRAWNTRPHAYAAVWNQDFDALLRKIEQPLLLMCAPDDLLAPFFDRACALRPDATAVMLSGGTNFEPDLASGEVASSVLKFIE